MGTNSPVIKYSASYTGNRITGAPVLYPKRMGSLVPTPFLLAKIDSAAKKKKRKFSAVVEKQDILLQIYNLDFVRNHPTKCRFY